MRSTLRSLLSLLFLLGISISYAEEFADADETKVNGELRFGIVYFNDADSANSFKDLLEKSELHADLIQLDDMPTCDLAPYNAIIVTSDIEKAWSTSAVQKIRDANKPVLGIGEGGCYFFDKLNLGIGAPHVWHGADVAIKAVHSKDSRFWNSAELEQSKDEELVLYSETEHVGVYLPVLNEGVVVIGQELGSRSHYPIVEEKGRYLLWGFSAPPEQMTKLGKSLFIHTCRYITVTEISGSSGEEQQSLAASAEAPADIVKHLKQLERRIERLEAATTDDSAIDRHQPAVNVFVGDWAALAEENRGVTRIVIREDDKDRWEIQAWGACHPTDCDWGAAPLDLLGDSVAGEELLYGFTTWDHGFKQTSFTLRIENEQLVVESYDIFNDNSGRSNYRRVERFRREPLSAAISNSVTIGTKDGL